MCASRRQLLGNLGTILLAKRKPAEAEPLLRDAVTRWRAAVGEGRVYVAITRSNLATALRQQRKLDDADTLTAVQSLIPGRGSSVTAPTATPPQPGNTDLGDRWPVWLVTQLLNAPMKPQLMKITP